MNMELFFPTCSGGNDILNQEGRAHVDTKNFLPQVQGTATKQHTIQSIDINIRWDDGGK